MCPQRSLGHSEIAVSLPEGEVSGNWCKGEGRGRDHLVYKQHGLKKRMAGRSSGHTGPRHPGQAPVLQGRLGVEEALGQTCSAELVADSSVLIMGSGVVVPLGEGEP